MKKCPLCFVAGVLTGVVFGTALFCTLVSSRIEGYMIKVKQLESVLEDRDSQLDKLEESMKSIKKDKYIIKEVQVYLSYEGDESEKILFEKTIREKYRHLIGKEVAKVDAQLMVEVVQNRIFVYDDNEFKLSVKQLILADVTMIWVSIDRLNR